MTPLNVPWGKKAPIPKEPERPPVPVFLGVTNERVKDQAPIENDPTAITIQVNGVKGVPNNTFKVRWSKGTALGVYLKQLHLSYVALKAAVRDLKNPDGGRLRSYYIPEPGAHIVLGNPTVSSALIYQRSSHDAQRVARNMGDGAKFVDVPLRRR